MGKEVEHWLNGEKEIYLIVDEAHHSTAKTCRKVIDYAQRIWFNISTHACSSIIWKLHYAGGRM